MSKQMVDEIVEQSLANIRAQKKVTQDAQDVLLAESRDAAVVWVGPEFYELLKPYITEDVDFFGGKYCEITWKTPLLEELELSQITIHWCPNYRGGNWIETRKHRGSSMADALLYARACYQEQIKENLEWDIEKATKALRPYQEDEEGATAAYSELLKLKPERKEEWDSLMAAWQAGKEQRRVDAEDRKVREAKEQENRELHERLMDDYVAQLRAWQLAHNRVLEHNEAEGARIQEAFNQTFGVWKLTYGICAQGEEGSRFADTDFAWVLEPEPTQEGWLFTSLRRVKIFFPISLEEFTKRPTDDIPGTVRYAERGVRLCFAPGTDSGTINGAVANLLPLPGRLNEPTLLAWHEIDLCRALASKDADSDEAEL